MNMRRFLAICLSLCMVLSLVPFGVFAVENEQANVTDLAIEKLDGTKVDVNVTRDPVSGLAVDTETMDPNEMVKVIIVMEAASVIESDSAAVVSDATLAMAEKLEAAQTNVIKKIEQKALAGKKLDIGYNYTWLLNGVSATVPYGAIEAIKAVDGVAKVLMEQVYQVCETTNGSVAAPMTITDGVMIGREAAWATGYTGAGMKVAVIDTGLDTDHQNFEALSADKLTDESATKDTVANVLDGLNAAGRYAGLTADDVYYSTKVAFGFNYCDNNLNITHDYDSMGDHGTHVAGIAAANKAEGSEVVGVAPDAQLYILKVFGANGGAYSSDILAALEDALMLGADVINMSLGSPAGFTSGEYTSDGDSLDEFYNLIAETGTVLSVSAGNNYNSGYANQWGTDANLTAYPDDGVLGSPGTYANTMTVASVENWMIQQNYMDVDGYYMTYNDSSSFGLPTLYSLTGEYEVVVVPGNGEPADYEGLDVTGKIALVQRGVISFVEKHVNAEAAGAVACLVYNNTSGTFGMDMTDTTATTPAAAITLADGNYLIAALEADPALSVSFPAEPMGFPSELAYQMSDFSSKGPAPDLTLALDIAAPGGNIYSTINDGQYGLMSGTSMAAPNLAGMTAVVMQYVKSAFPAGTDVRSLAQSLLTSTSVPLVYDEETGIVYSPRNQGSGLANVYNAIATNAYLTVDGAETAKADLGDNAEGVYGFSYNVHNFGDTAAYYDLTTSVQTEDYMDRGGYYFMAGAPRALSAEATQSSDSMILTHDVNEDGTTGSNDAYWIYQAVQGAPEDAEWEAMSFRYDTTNDDAVAEDDVQAYLEALVGNDSEADLDAKTLMVAAGETAVVDVNVTLSDADKTYFDTYFVNGGYVEGYTFLEAQHTDGIDLSLPYLGFYGDWSQEPVLDNGNYWDLMNAGEGEVVGNQYAHVLFSQFQGDDYGIYPGLNPYVENDPMDPAHFSVSPDEDGYMDTITDLYLSLMRNASELTIRYTDMETGEVYYEISGNNVSKSVYMAAYDQMVPFVYTMNSSEPLFDWANLENNTKVLFEAEVVGVSEGDEPEIWSVPITVDLEAPELLGAQMVTADDGTTTLELNFRDNVSTAGVILTDPSGMELYGISGVEDVEPDENGYQNYTLSFDITGVTGKLMIILGDYAINENYYAVNLGGEGASYGDLVAYQYNYSTGVNGWVSFGTDVNADETTMFMEDTGFVAAEYVNGFVLAQADDGKLYGFPYEDMLADTVDLEETYITTLSNVYQDFAYSYAEGKLYGLFTYDDDGYPTTEIYSINIKGEYYDEDMWTNVAPYQEDWLTNRGGLYGLTLAINDNGDLHVLGLNYDWNTEALTETAHLWVAPRIVEESRWGSYVDYTFADRGDTGLSMDYLQSMTFDHNTEKLYWARFDAVGVYTLECQLVEIDPATAEAAVVGTLSGETCALFAPLTEENAAKAEHANVPDMDRDTVGTPVLRDSSITMNLGGVKTLTYDFDPWYTAHKDLVWSSDNTDVVTVDANGTITAVNAGSATITVANAADESKCDTVTVEVTALDLKLEGIITAQTAGVGGTGGVSTYTFQMADGVPSFGIGAPITAPAELNYGLSLATSAMGRGSLWACEYGNTGMIYEIDAATGVVKDALQPIDGDMLFGLAYSESQDTFTGIMNYYIYADLELTHEESEKIVNSYDEEQHMFTYHRLDMLPFLQAANGGFVTGETGQGASSEIVFSGITVVEGGIKDSYGETYYYDTYKDYLGNWAYGGECSYQPVQTLVLLDNVGRLWYVNEVTGVTMETDDWGNVFMTTPDGGSIDATRPGITYYENVAEDGTVTYNVFHITKILETPLTAMFREGSMPRITYHFSDIAFAGYTAEGDPMFAMSLYDYWNNGTTNELYLYIPGHDTGEMDYETWEPIITPDRLFDLGDTGAHNIIASIHSAEVTGGVDPEETEETFTVNAIGVGAFTR